MRFNKIFKAEKAYSFYDRGVTIDIDETFILNNGEGLKIIISEEEDDDNFEVYVQYSFAVIPDPNADWYYCDKIKKHAFCLYADSDENKGHVFLRTLHLCGTDAQKVYAAFDAVKAKENAEMAYFDRLSSVAVVSHGEITNYCPVIERVNRTIAAVRAARETARDDFSICWDDGQTALWHNLHPYDREVDGDKEILQMISRNTTDDATLMCAVASIHTGHKWDCVRPNGNVAIIYDSDMIESNEVMRMARTVAPEIYM